jgi:hypothetical protein
MRAEHTVHLTFSHLGITTCSAGNTGTKSTATATPLATAQTRTLRSDSMLARTWLNTIHRHISTRVEWGKASSVPHYTKPLLLLLLLVVVVVLLLLLVAVVVVDVVVDVAAVEQQ